MSSRTPSQWFEITQTEIGWREFYEAHMRQPISHPERFFKAVESLGHVNVFSAIISASLKKLEGDPLPYILAIALNKFSEQLKEQAEGDKYELSMTKTKKRIKKQNQDLEVRIERARKVVNGTTE